MRRYVSRWEADSYEDCSRTMTVHASEQEVVETGLLDETGEPICAVDGPESVGFHLAQWGFMMGCKKGKGGRKK